ncbi:uncharacterized protein BP5553_07778 [Venustampulla echinocandica]|uniref:Uncharacterized protein n=1 Tax=Venustampulla echinocandica TaxID=2656787 RepID=A0A370THJ1_9HELO|nr:uncharacterized protein BP5553_07778 [Venustampulla echinocandica]RDL34650.1 hypothetical protein BP5553_07778 [Venustampulla echinocandica]
MRLLYYDNDGKLSLAEFFESNIPKYAILSHRWGAEEVIFKDLMDSTSQKKAGYSKIDFCGEQARRDGLQYFWVDTCCIDKSNSTELAEAINSMFRWYQDATKCYVYLPDVSRSRSDSADGFNEPWELTFRRSEWFTRGWTLQELIAPASVEFFSKEGELLGNKISLEGYICEATEIPVKALRGSPLRDFSFAERMSWAANRETFRQEDKAYSLLGIFGVSMPLIYGEGKDEAFDRLEEELHKRERKRNRGNLSTLSPLTSGSTKRLKTLHCQSSVPSSRNSNSLNPETPIYFEDSVHNIDATTKQSLIDQLYFTKIDERLTSLTAAQGTTCRWFLTKPEYTSWNDVAQQSDHNGLLWIKGNPGTGKSTLMKFLFEKTKVGAKGDPSPITLSFFFLARGTVEEKSTKGLYRSLLHQLFEKAVELRDSLEWMTADGARGIQRNGWHEEALKQTLAHAIQKLGSRSLTIFVDALDECDQSQVTDMLSFFEDLCDRARETQVQLQICFSSRQYPTVVIQKGVEVTLDGQTGHMEDIKQYIKSKLRLGKSKQAESLGSEIFEKSSGIFLWVVLVLDILNAKYPGNSISIKKIRERLKEIPPKLADLFEMILTRDGENLEQLQVCLRWVLFATRPLKPQELYFAIQLTLDKKYSSCWDQEDIDLDQMKTFVRNSSKGLAEVTRKASEVQFIHESVRDFLLGKYEDQWSGASGNFVGHSHENLRNCCLAQLNTLIEKDVDIPDPLPQSTSETKEMRDVIRMKFPFFEYSVINILSHSNSAQQNGVDQAGFFSDFPLPRWIWLNNALEKDKVRRYTMSVSMLYLLAEKNLADLIRVHPERKSCFNIEDERYGLPFFAALATKSSKAICSFLDIQAETQPSKSPLYNLCKQYCQDRNKWANFGRSFCFSQRKSVPSYAAEYGDEILLSLLIELGGYMPNSKDKNGWTPLYWASRNGHVEVVKLLLEKGADLNAATKSGETPFHQASGSGHVEVVKLLLEKEANPAAADDGGWTPLYRASGKGHVEVVKLLLEKGADLVAADRGRWTALYLASENGHVEVVKLLLGKGAYLTAANGGGWTALYQASRSGHVEVVKLLLEKGADPAIADVDGRTPLY